METFSALLALCEGNPLVTGGFQRPVMRRSFDGFFDLRLNKRLNKQSRHRWFETPSRSLWRHCNACIVLGCTYTISAVFSCDQAALIWALLSVRPSVCLSVCHTFFTMFCHRIIVKFPGVITIDKSYVHAKVQGQRSKIKVTEVKTQLSRFRAVTPVWIHIWWWNDAHSLMFLRRGAPLFLTGGYPSNCKVTRLKKSSILTQIGRFRNSSWNSPMAIQWCTKLEAA